MSTVKKTKKMDLEQAQTQSEACPGVSHLVVYRIKHSFKYWLIPIYIRKYRVAFWSTWYDINPIILANIGR